MTKNVKYNIDLVMFGLQNIDLEILSIIEIKV